MAENELRKKLYTRQVNYELMYLMWQAYRNERSGEEFDTKFGLSRTTRYNITSQVVWDYDEKTKKVRIHTDDGFDRRISTKKIAPSSGLSVEILVGNKMFEITEDMEKDLQKYICFKQDVYRSEYKKELRQLKNSLKESLKNMELSFEKQPELLRLRNFCRRDTAEEIGIKLDEVFYLTKILNVNTVEEIYKTEQYEKLKVLLPQLKTFCEDMETIIKYKELKEKQ